MEDLIYRKLSGNSLTDSEQELLNEWLEEPKNQKTFFQLRLAFTYEPEEEVDESKRKLWVELEKSLNGNSGSIFKPALRWAASILIICLAGFLLQTFSENNLGEISNKSVEYYEKASLRGQKLTVFLPDGSKVKLNAGSKIHTPDFFGNERKVFLEGEAFFEVQKSSKPFIVSFGDVEVKVLGTSFNINCYSSDQISVAVAEGKVAVSAETNDFYIEKDLLPGERLIYNDGEPVMEVSNFDHDEILGWKDNILVFKQRKFKEVTHDLNKWYGVTFIVDEGIDFDETYNGTFANPVLTEVMESLAHLYTFKYEIHKNQVSIYK